MSEVTTDGLEHVPNRPVTIFPNRVNMDIVRALEQAIGATRLVWLVNYDDPKPNEEVMQYLTDSKAAGSWISLRRMSPEMISEHVHDLLKTGRHVVLLPYTPAMSPASLTDVAAPLLGFLDNSTLPILPVYAGMYSADIGRAICNDAPYDKLCVRFMPLQQAGGALGSRVRGAWMEAAALQFAEHPLLKTADLREALLNSLQQHPQARIIDGVDDSHIDFETLLSFALQAAKRLSKETLCHEVGIILPPGKLSIIANLACLFAGIVPVNFNYTATGETFRAQIKLSGVSRYITEHRFPLKQHTFAWPRKLDQIFIDDLLRDIGTFRIKAGKRLIQWGKTELVAMGKKAEKITPGSTVTVFFTKSPGSATKGVPATHGMLLAAVAQMQARLQLTPGERVLSVTPYYEPHGFLLGMLLPLLCGLDIVTYPDMKAPARIGVLCENFSPVLATFSVPQCYELLAATRPEAYAAMRHCLVTGSRIPVALYNKAFKEFKLTLHNAYTLAESAAIVSMGMPTPEPGVARHALPGDAPGTTGSPLVGTGIRIVDTDNPNLVLPPGSTGAIWLRSPALPADYIRKGKKEQAPAPGVFRAGWLCTGDIGSVDDAGMLRIYGRSARFSKVGGVVTSHEMVEEVILNVLKQETTGPRKLAIIPDGDRLILLSTIHNNAGPQDVLTLRYAITNAHHSIPWPDKIISVRAIPVHPNGQPDYKACLDLAYRAMGRR